MNTGKQIRMRSIFRKETGKTVIVAADHGGIAGPLPGIREPARLIADCVKAGADGVLTTRGFARAAAEAWDRQTSLILRLTGGFTTLGGKFEERMISSAEAALLYGACGVAATVKFGHEREGESISAASLLADECERWGLPLMIEAFAVGKGSGIAGQADIELAARAAAEIGADFVKIPYTGDPESFARVVEGCPVPVLILGGEGNGDAKGLLSCVADAMRAGAKGVAFGRNIWQYAHTRRMVEAISGLVHEGWSVELALEQVRDE